MTTVNPKPAILMVDDRLENLVSLEKCLRRLDVILVKATSGNEALTLTLHQDFALILLDVQMPEMNGYEVAEYLRSEQKTQELPIIFVTAIDRDEGLEIQGYQTGAVDYIFKPINPKILLGKVKIFVELYQSKQALQQMVVELQHKKDQLEQTTLQLKTNQRQLIQSEKMASLGQLAAGVAHEINNPMGFIMSNLDTLGQYTQVFKKLLALYEGTIDQIDADQAYQNDEYKRLISSIQSIKKKEELAYIVEDVDELLSESNDGAQRVKEIVHSLKCFARADGEQFKEFNLNEGIESTLKIVWSELKYKCELDKKYGDLPPIHGNPTQLNQVFMNLLVNAVQAIPDKGKVTIETFAKDSSVVIRISDTGKGIEKKDLSRLFDPFYTTKPQGQGTGLGLSISHGIVQKHNGSIDVQSELGKGSTFTICLPIGSGAH